MPEILHHLAEAVPRRAGGFAHRLPARRLRCVVGGSQAVGEGRQPDQRLERRRAPPDLPHEVMAASGQQVQRFEPELGQQRRYRRDDIALHEEAALGIDQRLPGPVEVDVLDIEVHEQEPAIPQRPRHLEIAGEHRRQIGHRPQERRRIGPRRGRGEKDGWVKSRASARPGTPGGAAGPTGGRRNAAIRRRPCARCAPCRAGARARVAGEAVPRRRWIRGARGGRAAMLPRYCRPPLRSPPGQAGTAAGAASADSRGWLEYFADGPNAAFFAAVLADSAKSRLLAGAGRSKGTLRGRRFGGRAAASPGRRSSGCEAPPDWCARR